MSKRTWKKCINVQYLIEGVERLTIYFSDLGSDYGKHYGSEATQTHFVSLRATALWIKPWIRLNVGTEEDTHIPIKAASRQ